MQIESMPDVFEWEDMDDEIMSDFIDSVYEAIEYIEHDLATLEREPENENAINGVFRSLHSIKGNARMCSIEPLDYYGHVIEEIISDIRSSKLKFSPLLKEVILLALDHFRSSSEEIVQTGRLRTQKIKQALNAFMAFHEASPAESETKAKLIIKLYTGEEMADVAENTQDAKQLVQKAPESDHELEDNNLESVSDLAFFMSMAEKVDARSPYWEGRTKSILKTCLMTNKQLPEPVDERQLAAAVYIHDVGMGMLPDAILNKNQRLNALEEKNMRDHTRFGSQLLLRIPGWELAAKLVSQHHERIDGKGYPEKLSGKQIHIGAQLISISDTFYSLTNQRADRAHKRSLLRAITEINACKDSQFCSQVVEAFNLMVRSLYSAK